MAINGTGVQIFLYKYHDLTATGVLQQKLDLIGIVEDFISMIFIRSWAGVGDWQIVMPTESPKTQLFREAQFIKIHDKACGFINQEETVVDDENNTTTFKGSELKGLTSLRIIDPTSFSGATVTMSVGELKKRLIDENICSATDSERVIPSFISSTSTEFQAGPNVKYHPVYAELGEVTESLSSSTDTGWYADIKRTSQQIAPASKNRLIWERDGYPYRTNVMTGAYINSSGVVTPSPGDAYTDYIKVGNRNSATPMVFYGIHKGTRNGNKRIHLYEETDYETYTWRTQIGVQQNVTPNSAYQIYFTIPAGMNYYIRCSFVEADEDVMLEATPKTSYEPYHDAVYDTFDRIVWEPSLLGLDCTKDKTQTQLEAGDEPVIISYNLDTLYKSSLSLTRHLPNVAYVAGQGQGQDRTIAIVDEYDKTGLDRFEKLIDARDLADETALPQRGLEYLAQFGTNIAYTGEATNALLSRYPYTPWYWDQPSPNRYDDSVEIGNYGTFVDEINNFTCDFEITAITEVYEEDTFRIELQFGYDANNLNDNLSILASRTQGLLNADPVSGGGGGSEIYLKYWLGIKDGVGPTLKLLPSNAAETAYAGEQSIVGNYGGYLSLIAKNSKDSDATSRTLKLNDSSAQSNIKDALQLVNRVNGTDTTYSILHTGNITSWRYSTLNCTNLNATGNIFTTGTASSGGNIYTNNGDIYTDAGGIYTNSGDIYTDDGSIYTMGGDISATGDISAGGAIDANSASITNTVSCKKVHIEDNYYPIFELKPTYNSTTRVIRVEGSYAGNVSLQCWTDSTGNTRRSIVLYDNTAQTNVANALQIAEATSGTWKYYKVFHQGNASFVGMVVWSDSSSSWPTIVSQYGGTWESYGSVTSGNKTYYAYHRTA